MNVKTPIAVLAVVGLSTAGCGGDDDADAGTTPPTIATDDSGAERAAVLFTEPFDDDGNGWGIIADPNYGTTEYADGDYVWDFRGNAGHLLRGSRRPIRQRPARNARRHRAGVRDDRLGWRSDRRVLSRGS